MSILEVKNLRKSFGGELVLEDVSFIIYKQFAGISFREGVFGYPFVGQWIGIIAYLYLFCVHRRTFRGSKM